MEEQLISFEIAKLAKKKGFDTKVLNHYKGIELINNGRPYNFNSVEEQVLWSIELTSAPTQSILQRWLREVHGIDITVIPEWQKEKRVYYVGFSYINSSNKLDIFFSKDNDVKVQYKTYEEALEIGLQESLKLIP